MKTIDIKGLTAPASNIAVGCMRSGMLPVKELASFVNKALELGINFFDHADIYGGGECERQFGLVLKEQPGLREQMLIQSKCGIDNGSYNLSKEHILKAADGILQRLGIEYLDLMLLHRPDALMEPEEIAEAFDILESSGKVRVFGTSNFNTMQFELLKQTVKQPLAVNQMQYSIMHTGMVDSGLLANTTFSGSENRDGSFLDYSRLHNILVQVWSPFQYGFFEGVFVDNDKFPELNAVLQKVADNYSITKTAVAVAWIMRHPARMQTIAGTTNETRLEEICQGAAVPITRKEWYEIWKAAGNRLP